MKKDNIAGEGGSPPHSSRDRVAGAVRHRSTRGPNQRLDTCHRQVQLLAGCLLDVCRIMKQEGWVDVLDDEFHDVEASPEVRKVVR